MRWFATLSSAVLISMTATAQADQSAGNSQSGAVRQQSQTATSQTPSVRTQTNIQVLPNGSRYPQVVTVRPDEAAAKPAPAPVPETPVVSAPAEQPVVVQSVPAQRVRSQPAQRQSQGLFGQIMELERRKNAWLRGLFR